MGVHLLRRFLNIRPAYSLGSVIGYCLWGLLGILPQALSGQVSPYKLLYQIPATEAAHYYQATELDTLDLAALGAPLDTLLPDQVYHPHLPGHYVRVGGVLDELESEFFTFSHLDLKPKVIGRKVWFTVTDIENQIRSDAEIIIDGRSLTYDTSQQAYLLRRIPEETTLRLTVPGDTSFYQFTRNRANPRLRLQAWRNFKRTRTGWVLTRFYYWPVRAWQKIRLPRNERRYIQPPFRPVYGYAALSQPRYRLGDTLRFSAYPVKVTGGKFRRPWRLTLKGPKRKVIFDSLLRPDASGRFHFQQVLADSLDMGSYHVNFTRENRRNTMRFNFRLSDYELTAESYTLKTSQSLFLPADTLELLAEAKDANGFPAFNVQMDMVLRVKRLEKWEPSQSPMSDTLFTYHGAIVDGKLKIVIPDSLLPHAKVKLLAKAYFQNAKGDLVDKDCQFTIDKRRRWQMRQQKRFLYLSGPVSDSQTVNLLAYEKSGALLDSQAIAVIPTQIAIDPKVFRYKLLTTRDTLTKQVRDWRPASPLKSYWNRDSLHIVVDTITSLPSAFRIENVKGRVLLADTITEPRLYSLEINTPSVKAYYRYYWGGVWHEKRLDWLKPQPQLSIDTDQPTAVMPGATVATRIQVTDTRERPVKKARIHLSGLNAQFRENYNRHGPIVARKRTPTPLHKWHINIKQQGKQTHYPLLTSEWASVLSMDTLAYQRLRQGKTALILLQDTIQAGYGPYLRDKAQFAPYLFREGRQEPIHLIYCNRQLVYYHGISIPSDYAFLAQSGYNQLSLRSYDEEWVIDSINLRAGWKTEIALHIDRINHATPNIHSKPVPDTLTTAEKELLTQRIFQFRPNFANGHLLYDTLGRVFQWSQLRQQPKPKLLLGPFAPKAALTYKQLSDFEITFPFQTPYIYELYPERERLYQRSLFSTGKNTKLPRQLATKIPGDILRDGRRLQLPLGRPTPYIKWRRFSYGRNSGGAKLALSLPTDTSLLAIVVFQDTLSATYKAETRQIGNLKTGLTRLRCFTQAGQVSDMLLNLQAHTTHFVDLRHTNWEVATDSLQNEVLQLQFPITTTPLNPGNSERATYAVLYGKVLEAATGDPILFGSVALYANGILIKGTETDFEGNYSFDNVAPGWYAIEVSYLGLKNSRIEGIHLVRGRATHVLVQMEASDGALLETTLVKAYRISPYPQDRLPGATLTSAEIQSLPTRNVNALRANTAGLQITNDKSLNIRGSRTAPTSYYIDGVRVNGQLLPESNALPAWDDQTQLRSNFRDLAYWQANLLTDRNGIVETVLQFPDDITTWNTSILAAKGKRGGHLTLPVRAYQQLQAQLFVPRFLVEGDEVDVVGQSINLGKDTVAIDTRFWLGEKAQPTQSATLSSFIDQRMRVVAPSAVDSVSVGYALRQDEYTDGEYRTLPIRLKGTREARGTFKVLPPRDTSWQVEVDPAGGPVYIHWQRSAWPLLLADLERVVDYPYACNEQQASRLRALLVLYDQYNGGRRDSLQRRIIKIVGALQRSQSPVGYWGWFMGNRANLPLTLYVLEALKEAADAGYESPAYARGLRYLTNNLGLLNMQDRLSALHFLARIGQQYPYAEALQTYDTLQLTFFDHLQKQRIRQLRDLPYSLDTIYKFEQRTLKGSSYFGPLSRRLFRGNAATQALAHTILVEAGDEKRAARIRQYALLERGVRSWRNTLETTMWVKLLAPYVPKESKVDQAQLQVNGQSLVANKTYTFDSDKPLQVTSRTPNSAYFTAYQRKRDTSAVAVHTPDLTLTTWLTQNGKIVEKLEQGSPATLEVEADMNSEMNYAVLEIPIPAACGYLKELPRQYGESERLYLRDKVVIFYEYLPAEPLRVSIALEPRFTGRFTLNPAKLKDLYFPTFFTRTGLRRVGVD